ncbi:MAG: type II secretion system F family protein [Clostridia bacterium]|nr:type II secretion system F family protein [Clostridia bacterium]
MIRDYSIYEMTDREQLLFYSLGYLSIGFMVYLFYHSILLSLAGGLLIKPLKPYCENHMASRRMQKLGRQFKDLLYSLSSSVASGRQMAEAIIEACENLQVMYGDEEPIMIELNHMKKSMLENNENDSVLLSDFAARSGNEDIGNFVNVYVTCRSMGGDLVKIITHTSEILTDKMNIEKEIQAITAQKKLEGRLIALMPLAMLLILNVFSPSYIAPLYEGLMGRLIMTGCLIAVVLGVKLMEKISRIEI